MNYMIKRLLFNLITMRYLKWKLGVFVLLLYSCNAPNIEVVDFPYKLDSIAIDAPYLSAYANGFIQADDDLIFYGYNHWQHTIEKINITKRRLDGFIELEKEGPKGIQWFGKFMIYQDQLVATNYHEYVSTDLHLSNISRFRCDVIEAKNCMYAEDGQLFSNGTEGVHAANYRWLDCSESGKTIYAPVYPTGKTKASLNYKLPIGYKLNLADGEFQLLNVTYPKDLQEQSIEYLGLSRAQFVELEADRLLYNFPYCSKIFIYDAVTGETQEYKGTHLDEPVYVDPLRGAKNDVPVRERMEYEMKSQRFGRVFYHAALDCYSRIEYEKENDDLFHQRYNLDILDKDLKVIKRYKLPFQFAECYPYDKGLFFNIRNAENDDTQFYFVQSDFSQLL